MYTIIRSVGAGCLFDVICQQTTEQVVCHKRSSMIKMGCFSTITTKQVGKYDIYATTILFVCLSVTVSHSGIV